ncbi:MAG TPA: phospholipid carrier-dependent glycosyltransferase, partial [Opitutaceae bacterium]
MRRKAASLTAAALLCLYWWMATSISDSMCTTGDEIAHLTAGYSYWKTNDYRLQPENGNLPQRWAAIPLLHRDLKFPTLDQDAWRISDVWDLGFQWFYTLGNDLASMLRAGRMMIALLGMATGALVFLWARRLHGDKAALLAAGLFAFSPTMLANGALITSDMTATFMFLAAITAFWAMASRLSLLRVLLFGLALGLLCVAKFSAPLIAPMCAILFVVRLRGPAVLDGGWPAPSPVAGRMRIALSLIGATLAACALAVGVIWASYGFRYPMFRQFEPNRVRSLVGWDVLEDRGGPIVPILRFARAHELLPESYIYGFAHTYRFSRYRKAFLNGEYR